MRIDAHQHFWRLDRGDYDWLTPALKPLYQDFLPQDLAPHLAATGVEATILVQAAPTVEETHFLLELARATPFVAGVVGWVDMAAADAPELLAEFKAAGGGRFKGIRPMIQDIADPEWVVSPMLDSAFAALEALDLRFDALVRPVHLDPLLRRLERNPGLKVVIDHAAKPDVAAGGWSEWSAQLAEIASQAAVMCKLSGLVTEAGAGWRAEALAPFVEHVLESFGPERCMWGSDWPVVNLVADYRTWHAAATQLLAGVPARERAMVFGTTAANFYDVPSPRPGPNNGR